MPHLLPAEKGLKIYDPQTKGYLAEQGRDVPEPLGKYWQRLLAEGAVTIAKKQEAKQ